MESLQYLRDEFKFVKKSNSEAGLDLISASDLKPGPSKQSDLQISPNTNQPNTQASDKPMETDFAGPLLPPQFVQRSESEIRSDPNSEPSDSVPSVKPKKHSDKRKHKSRAKYVSSSSSSDDSEASVQVKKSFKSKGASSEQNIQKSDPDPVI